MGPARRAGDAGDAGRRRARREVPRDRERWPRRCPGPGGDRRGGRARRPARAARTRSPGCSHDVGARPSSRRRLRTGSVQGLAEAFVADRISVRIGELSRRVGVSVEALRAWERRYGVLRPSRSPSGYRALRPRRPAARGAHEGADRPRPRGGRGGGGADRGASWTWRRRAGGRAAPRPARSSSAALLGLRRRAGPRRLDALLGSHTADVVLRDIVIPVLHDIGTGWQRASVSVAQEHFASELIAGRLRGLGRGWDAGLGPRALLACPRRRAPRPRPAVLRDRARPPRLAGDVPGRRHAGRARSPRPSTGSRPGLVVLSTVRPEPARGDRRRARRARRRPWRSAARARRPRSRCAPARGCCATTPSPPPARSPPPTRR